MGRIVRDQEFWKETSHDSHEFHLVMRSTKNNKKSDIMVVGILQQWHLQLHNSNLDDLRLKLSLGRGGRQS